VTVAPARRNRYIGIPLNREIVEIMRAETETLVEEIKQSVGLLRRHL
jgi:hypothetical protein